MRDLAVALAAQLAAITRLLGLKCSPQNPMSLRFGLNCCAWTAAGTNATAPNSAWFWKPPHFTVRFGS
jgi:hypothetical protein